MLPKLTGLSAFPINSHSSGRSRYKIMHLELDGRWTSVRGGGYNFVVPASSCGAAVLGTHRWNCDDVWCSPHCERSPFRAAAVAHTIWRVVWVLVSVCCLGRRCRGGQDRSVKASSEPHTGSKFVSAVSSGNKRKIISRSLRCGKVFM